MRSERNIRCSSRICLRSLKCRQGCGESGNADRVLAMVRLEAIEVTGSEEATWVGQVESARSRLGQAGEVRLRDEPYQLVSLLA